MSSPGFAENLPCPAHIGSTFFKIIHQIRIWAFPKMTSQTSMSVSLCRPFVFFQKSHTTTTWVCWRCEFPGTYSFLSAAFWLQLKTPSCRRDGSSSRISSSFILQNLMELIVCLWLPSSFSKTKNGRTDDLCVLPKCYARRDMGLSKTIRKLSMAVFSAPLLDSKVFSLPSYVSACLLSPKFKIATRQTLWVLALPKNRHEHLLCSSCSAKRSSEW
jgi:hypothetical protein